MRKIYVEAKVKIVINADEGIEVSEIISEMDYDFTSQTDRADIVDTEILDYEITDSK
ncbi:MAG: hypothetical protein P9M03_08010 [Candidatus Theseobacter exili]|nr:hypothetical protein [Candidatus Theseobacter exili]